MYKISNNLKEYITRIDLKEEKKTPKTKMYEAQQFLILTLLTCSKTFKDLNSIIDERRFIDFDEIDPFFDTIKETGRLSERELARLPRQAEIFKNFHTKNLGVKVTVKGKGFPRKNMEDVIKDDIGNLDFVDGDSSNFHEKVKDGHQLAGLSSTSNPFLNFI
ncbi:hypothetical protein B5X24_HaOG206486 [Helicoverpa armigera]|uniref:Uncharacterized protein n=1 Tax=Helicoverpa armigera TaxID=29058 RepID=A0A2W1BNS2_HELAM|nr:hypothetical protein B5X24_HaOG206486 [Helicoverpa armigera]